MKLDELIQWSKDHGPDMVKEMTRLQNGGDSYPSFVEGVEAIAGLCENCLEHSMYSNKEQDHFCMADSCNLPDGIETPNYQESCNCRVCWT